jgi:hypothetical protein
VDGEVLGVLRKTKTEIEKTYRGLVVEELIRSEAAGVGPTFKEIASIIHASHNLVQGLDRAVLRRLDLETIAERTLATHLTGDERRGWNLRTETLWAGDPARTAGRLLRVLEAAGFQCSTNNDDFALSDSYLAKISTLSLEQARERFPRAIPE